MKRRHSFPHGNLPCKKTALQKQLCAKAKLEWEQTDTSCKHLSLELETYADTAVDHTRLTHQIENDTNRQNAVLTLQQMFAEYAAAQAVRDKQKQQAQQAEERYFTREKPAYDQIERQFFQSMAGNLARRLEPQKPCPVCGALEHPHPAACTEDTVTEEQFQKARESQQRALQNLETQKHETARREEHCRMLESQRQKQLEQCVMAATADAEEVRQLLEQLQMSIRENQQKLAALENRLNEEKRKKGCAETAAGTSARIADGIRKQPCCTGTAGTGIRRLCSGAETVPERFAVCVAV